jgi:hypothetical protein
MTDLTALTEQARETVDAGIRKIMDLRVELMSDGILADEVDVHLTHAVVGLMKYVVSGPGEAIVKMFQLKAEYDPKLMAANQDQYIRFVADVGAAQAEDFLNDRPQDGV